MRLTILGSGTAAPNGKRNSAGYFVELEGARVMLDCGAGTLHALARYGLPWEQMTHLFISHFHVDHVGELASLFFAFKWGRESERSEPLTLIGPLGLERLLEGLDNALGPQLFDAGFPLNLALLAPGQDIGLAAGATLSVAKTPHTRESLAVRIDAGGSALCYTGDTGYSDSLAEFFRGADLLISECSFRERRPGVAHLAIADVAGIAARARVAKLVVTHFYFKADDAEVRQALERGYSGEVIIGRDGLSIEL